ncbi:MAG: hypothetical protein KAR40_09775 [Candidatus Sabulitectum sp.]|nr:hypothetical protein [Candidatus Sabulitectum sp.]
MVKSVSLQCYDTDGEPCGDSATLYSREDGRVEIDVDPDSPTVVALSDLIRACTALKEGDSKKS